MEEPEFKSVKNLALQEPSLSEIMWFSCRNSNQVEQVKQVRIEFEKLRSAGVTSVRLGIACAEMNTEAGVKWYDWLLTTFGEYFEVELCLDNFSKDPSRSSSRRHSLVEILEHFIFNHGKYFKFIELWRNPAVRIRQEFAENIFSEDVVFAASWAKQWGKNVGLGRVQASDFEWISKLSSSMYFKKIDFVELDLTVSERRV